MLSATVFVVILKTPVREYSEAQISANNAITYPLIQVVHKAYKYNACMHVQGIYRVTFIIGFCLHICHLSPRKSQGQLYSANSIDISKHSKQLFCIPCNVDHCANCLIMGS